MPFRKKTKKVTGSYYMDETGGTMGHGEGMRNLTQEIAGAFDARTARVGALRQETAAMLNGFRQQMRNAQHELRRKATDLRRFLRAAESSRMRHFRTMHQGIRTGQDTRNRQVQGMRSLFQHMLSGFRQEHRAAMSHWHGMAAALAKRRAHAG